MNDNTWIQELKVGDVVYVEKHRVDYELPERATVSRITATQVVVALRSRLLGGNCPYDRKFRRSDGRSIGDNWKRSRLIQATPEVEAEYRLHKINIEARERLDQLRVTYTFTEQEAQDVIDFCTTMKDRLEARLHEVKG